MNLSVYEKVYQHYLKYRYGETCKYTIKFKLANPDDTSGEGIDYQYEVYGNSEEHVEELKNRLIARQQQYLAQSTYEKWWGLRTGVRTKVPFKKTLLRYKHTTDKALFHQAGIPWFSFSRLVIGEVRDIVRHYTRPHKTVESRNYTLRHIVPSLVIFLVGLSTFTASIIFLIWAVTSGNAWSLPTYFKLITGVFGGIVAAIGAGELRRIIKLVDKEV